MGTNEAVYRALDFLLGRLKRQTYRLDRSLPLRMATGIAIRRSWWLLRGVTKCLVLQGKLRFVYVAPQANLRNASGIHFGKGITLERGVVVDGLSLRGIEFGDNVVIGPYSVVRASCPSNVGLGMRMGKNSAVDAYSFIGAAGFIDIGENVIMGQHVAFHAENHNYAETDLPIKEQGTRRLGIVVEDDCWIGSNVTFLDGAHVETGCVIGAGSVVRGRIPRCSVAVGVPAKVVRSRLPEIQGESSGLAPGHAR
jgi:acetyltransferase-like isoleucine patch superfamily enzyme